LHEEKNILNESINRIWKVRHSKNCGEVKKMCLGLLNTMSLVAFPLKILWKLSRLAILIVLLLGAVMVFKKMLRK